MTLTATDCYMTGIPNAKRLHILHDVIRTSASMILRITDWRVSSATLIRR